MSAQTETVAADASRAPAELRPATEQENSPPPKAGPATWKPQRLGKRTIAAVIVMLLAAALAVLAAWGLPPFDGRVQSTDNAYVRGSTTIIAPQVSGYVVAVEVKDYDYVQAGQVLVRIDDRPYLARVAAARANLAARIADRANARAQSQRAHADMARAGDLVGDGSVSVRERDQTLAALRQADTQVNQSDAGIDAARAQLNLAQIDLDHTVIRASDAGQVGEVGVRLGQFVTNGTQLLALVPTRRWLIANFREAQTARMAPGQSAYFTVDALGGERFNGHVQRLSPATGSEFSVLRPDNATGNFVKVPQRIGVLIAIDPGQQFADRLRPGMSVEAHVDTRRRQQ